MRASVRRFLPRIVIATGLGCVPALALASDPPPAAAGFERDWGDLVGQRVTFTKSDGGQLEGTVTKASKSHLLVETPTGSVKLKKDDVSAVSTDWSRYEGKEVSVTLKPLDGRLTRMTATHATIAVGTSGETELVEIPSIDRMDRTSAAGPEGVPATDPPSPAGFQRSWDDLVGQGVAFSLSDGGYADGTVSKVSDSFVFLDTRGEEHRYKRSDVIGISTQWSPYEGQLVSLRQKRIVGRLVRVTSSEVTIAVADGRRKVAIQTISGFEAADLANAREGASNRAEKHRREEAATREQDDLSGAHLEFSIGPTLFPFPTLCENANNLSGVAWGLAGGRAWLPGSKGYLYLGGGIRGYHVGRAACEQSDYYGTTSLKVRVHQVQFPVEFRFGGSNRTRFAIYGLVTSVRSTGAGTLIAN